MSEGRGWSYFFINLRRRYINDRAWYGLGLMAVGFGGLPSVGVGWPLSMAVGLAGVALLAWGTLRK